MGTREDMKNQQISEQQMRASRDNDLVNTAMNEGLMQGQNEGMAIEQERAMLNEMIQAGYLSGQPPSMAESQNINNIPISQPAGLGIGSQNAESMQQLNMMQEAEPEIQKALSYIINEGIPPEEIDNAILNSKNLNPEIKELIIGGYRQELEKMNQGSISSAQPVKQPKDTSGATAYATQAINRMNGIQ